MVIFVFALSRERGSRCDRCKKNNHGARKRFRSIYSSTLILCSCFRVFVGSLIRWFVVSWFTLRTLRETHSRCEKQTFILQKKVPHASESFPEHRCKKQDDHGRLGHLGCRKLMANG